MTNINTVIQNTMFNKVLDNILKSRRIWHALRYINQQNRHNQSSTDEENRKWDIANKYLKQVLYDQQVRSST